MSSYCVVIEWDNLRLSEMGRARRMLAELFRQMSAVADAGRLGSVVVAFDAAEADESLVRQVVLGHAGEVWAPRISFAACPGARYYDLKNFGAQQANGDLLVFLDSDVIPESEWLARLLGAFDDPEVEVVCGNTFVAPDGLYGKAFALFWFFPLRREARDLQSARRFFANNVAFRRDVFVRHPFPKLAQSRGQCSALAETLVESGVGLFRRGDAWVSHPPPNGVRHFCLRAITEGHDHLANVQRELGDTIRPWRAVYWTLRANVRNASARIRSDFREVGLGRAGAAYAVALATLYYLLAAAGEVASRASPRFVRRFLLV